MPGGKALFQKKGPSRSDPVLKLGYRVKEARPVDSKPEGSDPARRCDVGTSDQSEDSD